MHHVPVLCLPCFCTCETRHTQSNLPMRLVVDPEPRGRVVRGGQLNPRAYRNRLADGPSWAAHEAYDRESARVEALLRADLEVVSGSDSLPLTARDAIWRAACSGCGYAEIISRYLVAAAMRRGLLAERTAPARARRAS